jgi:hypothetical protein
MGGEAVVTLGITCEACGLLVQECTHAEPDPIAAAEREVAELRERYRSARNFNPSGAGFWWTRLAEAETKLAKLRAGKVQNG